MSIHLYLQQRCLMPGPTELLVLNYLQDFQETVPRNFSVNSSVPDGEIVRIAIGNQLIIYRTLWRFENYIKKIARLPTTEDTCGSVFKGKFKIPTYVTSVSNRF